MAATQTLRRFQTLLAGAFAMVAMLLAATGLYGSLSHSVGRRQRELGMRLALGARRLGVLGLVLRQGMHIALTGLAIGMVGTLASKRVLTGFLYGVATNDAGYAAHRRDGVGGGLHRRVPRAGTQGGNGRRSRSGLEVGIVQ